MITTIFILIGAVILQIISTILGAFSVIIPEAVENAFTWAFSSIGYLSGIFPVADLIYGFLVLLSIWSFVYLIRIFLWLISFIPGVGHHELPSLHYRAGEDSAGGIKNIRKQLNFRNKNKGRFINHQDY